MTSDYYPHPIGEAAVAAARDVVQIASVAAVTAQRVVRHRRLLAQRRAARDERTRRAVEAHVRASRAAARVRWASANDPAWLRAAGIRDVASAWGAAIPYGDDPAAVSAVRACQTRLRELHPSAMAAYDRFRADGLGPVDAMRASVPWFARRPAREGSSAPRRLGLPPGTGLDASWTAAVHRPVREDLERELLRRRGHAIADGISGGSADTDELRVRLDAATNLPGDVIEEVVSARPPAPRRVGLQPWQRDFPFPISTVVRAAAASTAAGPSRQRPADGPRRGR